MQGTARQSERVPLVRLKCQLQLLLQNIHKITRARFIDVAGFYHRITTVQCWAKQGNNPQFFLFLVKQQQHRHHLNLRIGHPIRRTSWKILLCRRTRGHPDCQQFKISSRLVCSIGTTTQDRFPSSLSLSKQKNKNIQ